MNQNDHLAFYTKGFLGGLAIAAVVVLFVGTIAYQLTVLFEALAHV
jgi:hypothetical protein